MQMIAEVFFEKYIKKFQKRLEVFLKMYYNSIAI